MIGFETSGDFAVDALTEVFGNVGLTLELLREPDEGVGLMFDPELTIGDGVMTGPLLGGVIGGVTAGIVMTILSLSVLVF